MTAGAAVTQTTYYWTGGAGDGKWSSVGNWAMDSAGNTPATAYPGQNGFVKDVSYDSATIPVATSDSIEFDVDVTLWRIKFGTGKVGAKPLTISGHGHTVNLVNAGNNAGDRTHVYRELHVRDITINVTYWDSRVTTYFEEGAQITISIELGMWDSTSKVFVEDGASVAVTKNIYSYCETVAPPITVNGGAFSGNLIASGYNQRRSLPHKVVVNDGTVTLSVVGNSTWSELASDITINGGTVVLDKLSMTGASVFRMTGGDVSINNASSSETRFLITGGEKLTWLGGEPGLADFCDIELPPVGEIHSKVAYSKCAFVNTLTIPTNTAYHLNSKSPIRKLKMGAGSKLVFEAGTSVLSVDRFELDPTASIEVTMPTTALADKVHPIVICGPQAEDMTGLVTVKGEVPSGWTVRRELKCIYLWKDSLWDPAATSYNSYSNIWTGASSEGNSAQDADNWKSATPPVGVHSQRVGYGGIGLEITNTVADSSYTRGKHVILAAAGPSVLTGERFRFYNFDWGCPSGGTLNNNSPLPLTFDAEVKTGNSRAQISCWGTSFIAYNGGDFVPYNNNNANIGLNGHVKFTKDATIYLGLQLAAASGDATWTIGEVMPGVDLVVKKQLQMNATYPQLYKESKSILLVGEDASLVYENGEGALYGWLDVGSTNRIYGKLDVQCPMTGKGTEAYFGPGEFHIASTVATNGNCRVALGGGIRFSADEFTTASDAWVNKYALKIDVVGDAVLEAPTSWRYAVAEGSTTATAAADRALTIAAGGVLTVASTNGAAIVFGEQIDGAGTLKFTPGAKLAYTPALGIADGGWKTVATVGAVEGLPEGDGIMFRVVDNGDGTKSLKCRRIRGFSVNFR